MYDAFSVASYIHLLQVLWIFKLYSITIVEHILIHITVRFSCCQHAKITRFSCCQRAKITRFSCCQRAKITNVLLLLNTILVDCTIIVSILYVLYITQVFICRQLQSLPNKIKWSNWTKGCIPFKELFESCFPFKTLTSLHNLTNTHANRNWLA